MHPVTLAEALEREPFVPLRLHLSDGRKMDLHNPGLCHIAHLSLHLLTPGRAHRTLVEDITVVSLRHIVSMETVETSSHP